jgi:hypothetical protein
VKTKTNTSRYDTEKLYRRVNQMVWIEFLKTSSTYVNILVKDMLNKEEILFVASTV